MADRKITDLTALAAGSQATGDLLTIVDVSEGAAADKNKKITVENLLKGIPSNVGIGVSSPGAKLELRDNTQALLSWGDTAAIGSLSFDGSSQPVVRALSGKSLVFQTNGGNERMRIDSSGLVGLGTSSPAHELHISGSGDTCALITSGGSGDAVMMFENASGNTWGHGLDLSSGNYVIGYNASGDPSLTTQGVLNIDTSGNVGINTSSPTSVLHIKSDANNDVNNGILFEADDSTHKVFRLFENGTGEAYSEWYYQDSLKNLIRANGNSYFTGGSVGINVTSPDRKLEVVDTNSNGSYPLAVSNFIDATANKGAAVEFRLTTGGLSRGELGCKWVSSSSSDGTYFYFAPNDGSTGNVQRLRIDDDGLKFNSDTAAVNALDDYEEGTWTPTLTATSGSPTYATQDGDYTKIGRLVHCRINLTISNTGSLSGNLNIGGLPFDVLNVDPLTSLDFGGFLNYFANTSATAYFISVGPEGGTTEANLYFRGPNNYMDPLSAGSITNTFTCRANFSYYA